MERTDRISGLLDALSVDDLRRTTLQAIDHAFKSSAEVDEATAKYQGALGVIAALRTENQQLRERLRDQEAPAPAVAEPEPEPEARGALVRSAAWARRLVGR